LRGCGSRIGTPMGIQSMLRMPLADWQRLNAALPQPIESDAGIIRDLRLIKSQAEIAKIKHTCGIAERAFARVPSIAQEGVPLDRVYRDFQSLCLDEGADWVPYLAGASQQGGYGDVISPADDTPLAHGDVLMLDTGSIWDGYFCDYDRNFAVGDVSQQVDDAHSKLIDATLAAFDIAKPGITASDLFHVMDQICTGGAGGNGAGRNGHGLGMNLTEWPSFIPTDKTMLAPGMVLTLEPSIETPDGQTLVAEENIAITETGAMWLSTLAPRKMVRI
ncbi:MAG: M24 family metallopeptidase, partial [Planktomarina sp.]